MRLHFLFVASILWLMMAQPAHALPKFAREYGVTCQQCHSVPPRLNAFGLAFQANNFNWPGEAAGTQSGAECLSGLGYRPLQL